MLPSVGHRSGHSPSSSVCRSRPAVSSPIARETPCMSRYGVADVSARQDGVQVIGDGPVDLLAQTGLRFAIRAPAQESHRMTEAWALHLVELHLDHPLRPQPDEACVLVGAEPGAVR